MHCNDVIRELAVPTDDRDSASLGRASGELFVMRWLGEAQRSIRSSLGRDAAYGAFAPRLGSRMDAHRLIA